MQCPHENTLDDLVCGEIEGSARETLIEHVRQCASCKSHVKELLSIYQGLAAKVQAEPCTPDKLLEAYVTQQLPSSEMEKVRKHAEECLQCHAYLEVIATATQTAATGADLDRILYEQSDPQIIARRASEKVVERLMPGRQELFSMLWGFITRLFDTQTGSPKLTINAEAIVGALPFSGPPDPDVTSAAIVVTAALIISQQITEGSLAGERDTVEAAVVQVAQELGAGRPFAQAIAGPLADELLT